MSQPLRTSERLSDALNILDELAVEQKDELRDLLLSRYNKLRDVILEIGPEIEDTVEKAAEEFKRFAKETSEFGREKVKKMAKKVDEQAHDSPWILACGAIACGTFLGYTLGSRSKK